MPSNHLILCHPLLLPSNFPSIRVFANELALLIRWPKYWSFSFSISPSNEYSGLISFRIDWFDLAVQETLKSSPAPQLESINSSVLSFYLMVRPLPDNHYQFPPSRSLKEWESKFSSVQSTLCDPMNHSTTGLPVHHQLQEFTQTYVHRVGDAIQPSHPLSSPSPPAINLSQHQGLFKWVSSSHQLAKVLEFQLQHQSFQWTPRTDLL